MSGLFSCLFSGGAKPPSGDFSPNSERSSARRSTSAPQTTSQGGGATTPEPPEAPVPKSPQPATPETRRRALENDVAPLEPSSVVECSPFELLVGLKLGKALGKGTFGYVLKGLWQGAPVAVKVMVSDTLDRTVLRELLVGPHMHHPNVVHTYFTRCARLSPQYFDYVEVTPRAEDFSFNDFDSGEGFGSPQQAAASMSDPVGPFHQVLYELKAHADQVVTLVVMEYCDKTTMGVALQRGLFHASRNWSEVVARRAMLRTLQEVARGMIHLHAAGIVHGDLKPGNVLLRESRGDRRGFTAKLADFGLAHRLLPGMRTKLTDGSCGTAAYMAPEGFRGLVGFASDVYSFGVALWELLYGELPFNSMSYEEVVRGMLAGSLALEWRPCPLIPQLVDLGMRCVDPISERRPSFVQVEAELVQIEMRLREKAEEVRQRLKAAPTATAAAAAPSAPSAAAPSAAPKTPQKRSVAPPAADGPGGDAAWRALALREAATMLPAAATYTSDPSGAEWLDGGAPPHAPAALPAPGLNAAGNAGGEIQEEEQEHGAQEESYERRRGSGGDAGQQEGYL